MASPFVQARVTKEIRARAERAAEDSGVALGTWLRIVVEDALDSHEDVEYVPSETRAGVVYEVRQRLGVCSCPGYAAHAHCRHLAPPEPDPVPEPLPEGVRVEHPVGVELDAQLFMNRDTPPPQPPAKLSVRDCPHLPSMRGAGGKCRCGLRLSGMGRMSR